MSGGKDYNNCKYVINEAGYRSRYTD